MNCVVCGATVAPTAAGRVKDGYVLVRCESCGLLFRRDLPELSDVPGLYSSAYFLDDRGETGGYANYLADEELHRSLARRRLARIDQAAKGRRGALLDVGAAAGFFVAEAIAAGWDARGVDISPEMAAAATERVGAPVARGSLDDVDGGPFDVVTMWDYIEHSLDPAADVARAASLLRPSGILALSTGDLDSVVARLSGKRWHLLTPRHHNYFFSGRTIRMLVESHGFDVVDISRPGARYSVAHLAYKLERFLPGSSRVSRRLASSSLGRVSVPVNLFDITTVVARRTADAPR
jgi:SAM-dependent methyltransferase